MRKLRGGALNSEKRIYEGFLRGGSAGVLCPRGSFFCLEWGVFVGVDYDEECIAVAED